MSEPGRKPRYWMVRVHNQDRGAIERVLARDRVAVGWSEIDMSRLDDAALAAKVKDWELGNRPDIAASALTKKINNVRRWRSIRPGDFVVVPTGRAVFLGECSGEHQYVPDAKDIDLANQLPCSLRRNDEGDLLQVPRTQLTEALQRRLRLKGATVIDLAEYGPELAKWLGEIPQTWDQPHEDAVAQQEERFKRALLQRLQGGQVRISAGGQGLEELVVQLLDAEGFQATIPSKQALASGADVDIEASRPDPVLDETGVIVQVKHHRGKTGIQALEQLLSAVRERPEYAQDQMVIVTTGEADDALTQGCVDADVRLIDGAALVAWIYDRLEDLPRETLVNLGVAVAPIHVTA